MDADIDYRVGGSFTVENVDPTQLDAVVDTIKQSISQETGIPTSSIDVNYNEGVVDYTITTDMYDKSSNIKENVLNDVSFVDAIETSLENVDSNIAVSSPEVNDAVIAEIDFIVEARAAVDMTSATNNLRTEFSEDGFTVEKAKGTTVGRQLSIF